MSLTILGADGPGVASAARDHYDLQWNPLTGCTRISPGCEHCTAEAHAAANPESFPGLATGGRARPRWTGRVTFHPDKLAAPTKWTPGTIASVCFLSDLFHEDVPYDVISEIMGATRTAPTCTFQVLTKRQERAREWWDLHGPFPDNVWLGVTIEHADYLWRAEQICSIPAALHWISVEPMLGPVTLPSDLLGKTDGIDWVVAGPELGPGRRPCEATWMRALRDQCAHAGVPFFTKHLIDGQPHRGMPLHTTSRGV